MNKIQRYCYIKNFGLLFSAKVLLLNVIRKCSKNHKIELSDKINKYKYNRLNKEYNDYVVKIAEEYRNKYKVLEDNKINKIVWLFWMQNNIKDIPIVNMCINNIKKNVPSDVKVIIVNQDNIKEYSDISDTIWKKYKKGLISVTHLSDILRVNLVNKYGGVWLDATMFCADNINYIFEKSFWTIKRNAPNTPYISKGRWTGYAIGGVKHNILFYILNELLKKYYDENEIMIDFFLIDFMIELLYQNVNEVKEMIDLNTNNNENVQELWKILPKKFDKDKFNKLIQFTQLFKLTWRIKFDKNNVGDNTFYSYLINNYK